MSVGFLISAIEGNFDSSSIEEISRFEATRLAGANCVGEGWIHL